MSAYRTIRRAAEADTEVSRSRFRCRLERVDTEEAARAVVEAARREHRDAGHHCSAILLGPPPQLLERSHDDGEPAGTAGAPMLEVLRGAGTAAEPMADVVAVVTRWFGGTLLGAGGLVRAYGDAVQAALARAGTRRRVLLRELVLEVDHASAGRLESAVRDAGVAVLDQTYAAAVTLRLGVPPDGLVAAHALLAEVSLGRVEAQEAGDRWVDR